MGVFSGSSTFTGLLERATSQLQLEPDWASILQICDCVRQQDVGVKFAVSAMKKKIFDKNPHVSGFALTVLEACMKNCGPIFHDEIASKEFMDDMKNIIKSGPDPVKEKALGLVQTWSHAFRNESKYKIVQDTYNLLKDEGCQFPVFKESDAMYSADSAPTWAEGDICHMCRVKFGTFIRQHHCRNCGQVFCKKCSSKESIIPQFGIEREVRVCDPCYLKINPQSKAAQATKSEASSSESDLPAEYLSSSLSKEPQAPPKKNERELKEQEEEELQLAMALSLSQDQAQMEAQQRLSSSPRSTLYSSEDSYMPSPVNQKPASTIYAAVADDEGRRSVDPDLARYLNRSYWEDRREQSSAGRTSPSAPVTPMNNRTPAPYTNHTETKITSKGKKKKKKDNSYKYNPPQAVHAVVSIDQGPDNEVDQSSETIVNTFRDSVGMIMERMQDISGKGKHIAMDATVQSLFQTVSAMHPQLLRLIEQQEQETGKYEGIQEKLGLVKDARATLEGAREQHREKLRQQELEQDMLRRMQIEQKLELMRQQKAEYLAYQNRIQADRQLALEQQQQRYQMQQLYPGQYPTPPTEGSPYSSMVYTPPSGMQPPFVGGAPVVTTVQPPYNQTMSLPQGYTPQGYQVEAPPGQYGAQQGAPQYQPPETEGYPSHYVSHGYGMETSEVQQPATEYQPPSLLDQRTGVYSPQPLMSQPQSQQGYTSPRSSAPALSSAPPPQYNQATGQPTQHGGPPQYQPIHSNTQSPPPPQQAPPSQGQFGSQPPQQAPPSQGQFNSQPPQLQQAPPSQGQFGSQPPQLQQAPPSQGQFNSQPPQQATPTHGQFSNQLPPQQQTPSAHGQFGNQPPPQHYQPPPSQGPPPTVDNGYFNPPGQGGPSGHQGGLPLGQGGPPPAQSLPQGHLQSLPQSQGLVMPANQIPPQQQGSLPPPQAGYPPQLQPQGYEPQPQQQYQPNPPPAGNYYGVPQTQPSGPPPQRQLSDLELISFD